MNAQRLQELGLTHHEAQTYLALLETGETKTGLLVKKTGMHRVQIYDALESLIKKGLASYVIKENIKYFQAAAPERIVDFLDEKKEMAAALLPELKVLGIEHASKQSVTIYEGIRGLKSAMNNGGFLSKAKPYNGQCLYISLVQSGASKQALSLVVSNR
ncbi:hypothetical protein HZB02_05280 [Candidatus Woesearchaeota archaeon]|nr:hypothetical protein [Candidatus Woesearchaeota archaeon]